MLKQLSVRDVAYVHQKPCQNGSRAALNPMWTLDLSLIS